MHHNFAWRLDLLQTVECNVIEVTCAVKISLFIPHNLFEEVVTASFSLFFLEQKVVSGGDLIMLIILNIRYSLCQITIRTDA